MATQIIRPIQVFLDTQRLIQVQPPGTFGPSRDFFAGDNYGFRRHKARLQEQLRAASEGLRTDGNPAGFVMVQMREEGLGKSYRPLAKLFTVPHRFALVGGAAIGQMYFQATPDALDRLWGIIEERAEIQPRLVPNAKTGEVEERVSGYRSEVGAIEEIRLPGASDRLAFSASEGVAWLDQENVVGGYAVELFRPDARVTPGAVQNMLERFRSRLASLGGLNVLPFSRKATATAGAITLSISLRSDGETLVSLPSFEEMDVEAEPETLREAGLPDFNVVRHQALLDLLAREPLVRRIELPLRIESQPHDGATLGRAADIPPPRSGEGYPIVGVIDAGVARIDPLGAWRAGGADLVAANDRDEGHGSFIAGLLAGAGSLNPDMVGRVEPVPCRHFDLDILPRRGLISSYYQTPDEFFDQLETQVEAAKAQAGVRIFNMSLGAPGIRQGLGYSSFAANLDRIALTHDVIFVVSAGNLRGREARPEWPQVAEQALEMLATRAIAEERITAPGEHLFGLTVGAINPAGLAGITTDAPTTYSRRGPGPGGARKPELAHIGGASARAGTGCGLVSTGADGLLAEGCGTSYATPLVTSSLASLDHRLDGAARETLLALGVHKATKPALLCAKPLRSVARDFVGFGVPVHAEATLSDEPHSITLVFADTLPPRRELSFIFTWPRSLIGTGGKCRGHIDLTLAHTPPVDAAFDAECQRAQLFAGLYQLEEKVTNEGEIVADPRQRLNACDNQLPAHLEYTERYLLESGLKWTPIKRYEKHMLRGCGTSSEWRLSLKGLTRAGAIYPEEGIRFALVLTISDTKKTAPIYEEVRAEILRRGLRLSDITVAQRVRARG